MHKVHLSKNNYQLVAENSGQSPEVLMSNCNEALESEKHTLSLLAETSFYPNAAPISDTPSAAEAQADVLLQQIQQDPVLSRQLLQKLLLNAQPDIPGEKALKAKQKALKPSGLSA